MSDDLKIEYTLIRIRDKLNYDKVKLWLPPYHRDENTKQDDVDENALEKLAEDYSTTLGVDKNVCFTALQELQNHALDKLREKEVYKETGVAVVKVKISGISNSNSITASKIISVHINLSSETNALQKAVSEQIDILPERIKLISSGKVLNNNVPLDSQGIKHGMQIMAVILSLNSTDLQEYEKQMKILSRMKKDVKLLAAGMDNEDMYLQLTDQSGKTLNLPKEERKALITAMALHEKGKAALRKDEFALALVFFLEADKEYSTCQSQLLNSVDNYALLNLDIAWCYLCLKNVTQLPDAEKRLKMCESKFKFSYGPNLERLIALKGSSGNEAALLMRLHLLQGIVLFHQNKREEALNILMEAQQELAMLKVDDNSLCALIELGLTPAEARIGLRATKGCVNSAVDYIHRRRQEREQIRKQEKEDKERKKLGKCIDNNQYVDAGLVSNLEAMGFSRILAIEALRHSNNNINEAVSLLHQSPDILNKALSMVTDSPIFKELIQQVASFGYDPQMATLALKRHNGDIEKAVEELIACGGRIVEDGNNMPSSSSSSNEESRLHKLRKTQEAFNRFSEDVHTDYDDHLDLTLEQEEKFLVQYLSLLT